MSDTTVSMSQSALAAMIAAEVAKAVAAVQSTQRKSDLKVVVTRGIPSKSGRTWGTVEITDQRTGVVTRLFIDREHDAGKRKDGASQSVIYASEPKAVTPAPAAPAKPVVKATRKVAAKA